MFFLVLHPKSEYSDPNIVQLTHRQGNSVQTYGTKTSGIVKGGTKEKARENTADCRRERLEEPMK